MLLPISTLLSPIHFHFQSPLLFTYPAQTTSHSQVLWLQFPLCCRIYLVSIIGSCICYGQPWVLLIYRARTIYLVSMLVVKPKNNKRTPTTILIKGKWCQCQLLSMLQWDKLKNTTSAPKSVPSTKSAAEMFYIPPRHWNLSSCLCIENCLGPQRPALMKLLYFYLSESMK